MILEEAEAYRLKAEEWAKLDGAARRLEEMKKIVLHEIQQQSEAKTVAGKETAAYASPEYRRHVMEMVKARTEANICKASLDAMRLSADIWRTKESTKRAEMGLR